MKTKSIIAIACLTVGVIFAVFGIQAYFAYSKAVEEYPTLSHAPGSSLPYPAPDTAWLYLEVSGIFFVASGALFVIRRKRK